MRFPSLGQEDPLEEGMEPTPVFLPGESCGQRSVLDYSPRGCKELDKMKRLSTHTHKQMRYLLCIDLELLRC